MWQAAFTQNWGERVLALEKTLELTGNGSALPEYDLQAVSAYTKIHTQEVARLARQALQVLWERRLGRDSYLAFKSQDERSYTVDTRQNEPLYVAKRRKPFQLYPVPVSSSPFHCGQAASFWLAGLEPRTLARRLTWLIAGLLPAGLVTLAVGPFFCLAYAWAWWRLCSKKPATVARLTSLLETFRLR